MLNAFSVDVEDYFQVGAFEDAIPRDTWGKFEPRVEQNTRRLLDLCARPRRQGDVLHAGLGRRALAGPRARHPGKPATSWETHGQDHRRVTKMTPAEFREDIRRSKQTIEDIAGTPVIGYRAPNYSIVRETFWAMDILMEEGFRYDSFDLPHLARPLRDPGLPQVPAAGQRGRTARPFTSSRSPRSAWPG